MTEIALGLGWICFVISVVWIFKSSKKWTLAEASQAGILENLKRMELDKQNLSSKLNEREEDLNHLREERARLEAQVSESLKRIEEQKLQFEQSRRELENSFQALAAQALDKNSESFLKLATERLDRKSTEHDSLLEKKSDQFKQIVEPLMTSVKKLEDDMNKVEKERTQQFGKITEQLKFVTEASDNLRKEATSLSSALRRPEVRGSWGEMQLRRVVELAGMSAYCDFDEQVSVRKEGQLQKPDMLVHLPNERVLVIDSKAVLDAFLDAVEADDPEKKKDALIRHARNLRSRVKDLSKKSYWDQFENTPDFVVLFVPNEALLAAAVEVDRDILEDALAEKIIISTPTTLVALLKAVAYGWQQDKVAENAQQVILAAKELYERMGPWMKYLSDVGIKLNASVKSYNDCIGSLDRRVIPSVKRMKELGLHEASDFVEPNEIELNSREVKELTE